MLRCCSAQQSWNSVSFSWNHVPEADIKGFPRKNSMLGLKFFRFIYHHFVKHNLTFRIIVFALPTSSSRLRVFLLSNFINPFHSRTHFFIFQISIICMCVLSFHSSTMPRCRFSRLYDSFLSCYSVKINMAASNNT